MKNIVGQQSEEKSSPKQCDEKAPGASGNVTIYQSCLGSSVREESQRERRIDEGELKETCKAIS